MTACYCDYDETFTVYRKSEHTARKPHKCHECGRTINPGERYESAFGIVGGEQYTMPTCPHCLALREWVVAHVPCSCWTHGNLLDNMEEEVRAYGSEAPGLTFGYLRRLVAIQRARGWIRLRRPFRYYVSPEQHARLVAEGALSSIPGVQAWPKDRCHGCCVGTLKPMGDGVMDKCDHCGIEVARGVKGQGNG